MPRNRGLHQRIVRFSLCVQKESSAPLASHRLRRGAPAPQRRRLADHVIPPIAYNARGPPLFYLGPAAVGPTNKENNSSRPTRIFFDHKRFLTVSLQDIARDPLPFEHGCPNRAGRLAVRLPALASVLYAAPFAARDAVLAYILWFPPDSCPTSKTRVSQKQKDCSGGASQPPHLHTRTYTHAHACPCTCTHARTRTRNARTRTHNARTTSPQPCIRK